MISFTEYVKLNQNKAYNHTPVVVPEVKVKQVVKQIVAPAPVKEKDVYDYLKETNPRPLFVSVVTLQVSPYSAILQRCPTFSLPVQPVWVSLCA